MIELRICQILLVESVNSHNGLFTRCDNACAVLEHVDPINWTVVTSQSAEHISVDSVHDVDFQTTLSHESCISGSGTTTHDNMELRVGFVVHERTELGGIHWVVTSKVGDQFKGVRVENLGPIFGSNEHEIIFFGEGQTINRNSIINLFGFNKLQIWSVDVQISILSGYVNLLVQVSVSDLGDGSTFEHGTGFCVSFFDGVLSLQKVDDLLQIEDVDTLLVWLSELFSGLY